MTYQKYFQSVKFLESLSNLPIRIKKENSLSSVLKFKSFLQLINNPEKNRTFIHITGTAGKGSTANLIHNILSEAGFRVGTYFSPHTTTAIERIKVNQHYISPSDFVKLTNYLKPYLSKFTTRNSYGGLNFFESFLALALIYFQKEKCQYVVLEAGAGGLTDITNFISSPKISIITNIDKDHQHLGPTIKAIANNKAGIIKRGSIFLTSEKKKKNINLFKKICRQKKAKFLPLINNQFVKNNKLENISEMDNLQLAITASKILKVPNKKIIKGIKNAKLPCRFEIIQKDPMVILDGAHNPIKIKSLIKKITNLTYSSLNLIFGCASDKDAEKMLKQLLSYTNNLYLTRFLMPFRKTTGLSNLNQIAKKIKLKLSTKSKSPFLRGTQTFIDPHQALEKAIKESNKNDLILVTGSFFLCGELRKKWISEEKILKKRNSF